MFRRSKSESTSSVETDAPDDQGERQGATHAVSPEAEAAAKARAKTPRTRKEQMPPPSAPRAASRARRSAQAMRSGDERYLPPRDKGPVRRFIRDFVDVRFSFIELMVPLLILTMILGYSGNRYLANVGNTILLGTLLLVVIDMLMTPFPAAPPARQPLPGRAAQGHDLLRRDAGAADEVHADAQGAGQDRPEAARALPLTRRDPAQAS